MPAVVLFHGQVLGLDFRCKIFHHP